VFKKLFTSLREEKPDLIIAAGDVVHSKTDLTPELMILVNEFFEGLGLIAETYVLPGNHDFNVKNTEKIDALTPVFEIKGVFPHVHLIDTPTSVYKEDIRVDFHHLAHLDHVFDVEADRPFDNMHCVVAVAHGMLEGSRTKDGFVFTRGDYTAKHFKDYDIVMLGDIHTRQDLDGNATRAYSGSLIQQNFGEEKEKGYLLWDTDTLTKRFIQIENDHVYHTIRLKEGTELPDLDFEAKHLDLRVLWQMESNDITGEKFGEIQSALREKYNPSSLTVISIPPDDDLSLETGSIGTEGFDLNEFVGTSLQSIGQSENLNEDQISDLIVYDNDLNQRIEPHVNANNIWSPAYLEFDNLFSYGKGNRLDFDEKGITGIFAPNATGKSALVESFLYSVYGSVSRTKNVREIIRKGTRSCSSTVFLNLHEKLYRIKRKARLINVKLKITSGPKVTRATGSVDFEVMKDGKWVALNGVDKKETDKIIESYFGSVNDFLLTSFSAQGDIEAFINTQATDRKDTLIRFLGLDFLEEKYNLAKDELNGISQEIRITESNLMLEGEVEGSAEVLSNVSDSIEDFLTAKDLLLTDIDLNEKHKSNLAARLKPEFTFEPNFRELAEKNRSRDTNEVVRLSGNLSSVKRNLEDTEKQLREQTEIRDNIDVDAHQQTISRNNKLLEDSKENWTKIESIQEILSLLEEKDEDIPFSEGVCNICPLYSKARENKERLEEKRKELLVEQTRHQNLQTDLDEIDWEDAVLQVGFYNASVDLISSLMESKVGYMEEIRSLEGEITGFHTSIAERTKAIDKYDSNKENIEQNTKLRESIEGIEEGIARKNGELSSIEENLIDLQVRKKTIEGQLETHIDLLNSIDVLNSRRDTLAVYAKATHRDGIPYQAILNSLPSINMEVNNILSGIVDFSVFITPDVTDKKALQVYLSYEDGEERLIDVASGMEKMLTSLALRAALIKISRLPKPTIWVIDEGFGSLDKDNLQSMRHLFNKIKRMFDNIFIISHVGDLHDIADHEISITKKNGASQLG